MPNISGSDVASRCFGRFVRVKGEIVEVDHQTLVGVVGNSLGSR